MPRNGGLSVALMAGLAGLLVTGASAVAQVAPLPIARPAATGGMRVDRDRDHLFDDLEHNLAGRAESDQLNVIVTLRNAASAARVRNLERAVGDFALERRFDIVHAFSARASKRRIEALARNPAVLSVEEDSRATVANNEAQAAFGVSKARIDAPSLDGDGDGNPATYSPADYVAAVIDTGIDAGHMDLDGGKVIGWHDFVNNLATPYDDDGHGTHVSATIAGDGDARPDHLYHGVAPAAGLVGVKVLDANGSGTESDIIAGINWVVANKALYGIEAISMSLRIPGCSNGADALSTAVNNAQAAGLVVVVAAGNEGPGTCTIGSPSAATGALTVGAMADFGANGFTQAVFSSRGPTADGRIKPDVSAPGVQITSAAAGTVNGYITEDGTSMATPFVTGVTLLMLDANPALTPAQVRTKITSTAIDWARGGNNKTVGTTGQDIDYGFGRLDAYAALQSAGAPLTKPPLPPVHEFREGTLANRAQVNYSIDVDDLTFPLAATLIMPSINGGSSNNPDFDLFLFDPNGQEVASSEFTTRQEELGYKPLIPGTYTLRVLSFNGSGGYFVDISRAQAPSYARPASATPLRVPLVPAYGECTSQNTVHVLPLALPACDPPALQSSLLTTSKVGRGSGFVRLRVLPGNAATAADEADIDITVSATDVLRTADGTDFTGQLPVQATLRITDRANGYFENEAATATDVPFSAPVNCVATANPNAGGTCSLSTSADTLVPGVAKEGKRAVISALSVALLDRGPDDTIAPGSGTCPPTCGSGDEQPFLTEGLFTP
jgi:serine protease AprX